MLYIANQKHTNFDTDKICPLAINYEFVLFYDIGPRGLYNKTIRTRNVKQMYIFIYKQVRYIANHKHTNFDNHPRLLQNLYIMNP